MLRVIAASGGGVVHLPRVVYHAGSWVPRRIPARFGIIVHRSLGPVLVDTGYHPHLRVALHGASNVYHRAVPWDVRPGEALEDRLRALGFRASDVRHVLVTHLHADHIAVLGAVPEAVIWVSAAALDHFQTTGSWRLRRHGYFPELLPDAVRARIRTFDPGAPATSLAAHGLPWPEDPSIRLIPLPGHAPGHVGVWVPLGTRSVFFVGDATFSLDALTSGVLPSRPFLRLAFYDEAATRTTLQALCAWRKQHRDLTIIPAHAWEIPDYLELSPEG